MTNHSEHFVYTQKCKSITIFVINVVVFFNDPTFSGNSPRVSFKNISDVCLEHVHGKPCIIISLRLCGTLMFRAFKSHLISSINLISCGTCPKDLKIDIQALSTLSLSISKIISLKIIRVTTDN